MLNFRKVSAASDGWLLVRYYTENTLAPIHPPSVGVDPDGRTLADGSHLTAYYTGRDGRASWRHDMHPAFAAAIGIDPKQPPKDEQIARLFEARRADTGAAWSDQKRTLSGFDFVFAPHKSVTLAAEFAATPSETAAILNAIERAGDSAMRHIAGDLGWARRGKGGLDGAEPGAVGWLSFLHHTARHTVHVQDGPQGATYALDAPIAGDPHTHVHYFMMNLVATADGRVGSLDTKKLTDVRVKTYGAHFQAFLADDLRKLGMETAYDAGEQAVVLTAIPERANQAYSKRHMDVERQAKAYADDHGLDWERMSAEAKLDMMQAACDEGKLGKMDADAARIWRDLAAKLGWKHDTAMVGAQHEALTDAQRLEQAYHFAAKHLAREFHTAAVVSHDKLEMHAMRGLIGAGFGAGADDARKVVQMLERRGITLKGERVALVTGVLGDSVRVTNTAQVRIEEKLAIQARGNAEDGSLALGHAALRQAMARTGKTFTPEQQAAIRALGEGGALTMLTGVAGAGKTTLLEPLVAAWQDDRRLDGAGRRVIGAAMAWRQADALKDAGITETYAVAALMKRIAEGRVTVDRNTVLVLDEVSQIGPRPLLKLLEIQARTGMTIKMLGDREQAQAIEAGDSIELLRRVLPRAAMPALLTTLRQVTARGREVAGLFRRGAVKADEGNTINHAAEALDMKRKDRHALMLGGDRGQVVDQVAEFYIKRRDVLLANGLARGISVTAPTNEEVAEISQAIRRKLQDRGEIARDEVTYRAIDLRGATYDLAIARGDRVRLYRRTYGMVEGKNREVGSNGNVMEVLGRDEGGLLLRTRGGKTAHVAWKSLVDERTGRLMLGFGHALTIDAAQGITSSEHINALTRGTAGVTGFTTYVAESRSEGITWTLVAEGAMREAVQKGMAMGDITPVTAAMLWDQVARDMGRKEYKSLGVDLLKATRRDWDRAVDAFIRANHAMETAQHRDPDVARKIIGRARALAIENSLGNTLHALGDILAATDDDMKAGKAAREAEAHLRALRDEATSAKGRMEAAAERAARPKAEPTQDLARLPGSQGERIAPPRAPVPPPPLSGPGF